MYPHILLYTLRKTSCIASSRDWGDILWPGTLATNVLHVGGKSWDILGYPRHPGIAGTFVTWDFGHQCLRWDKPGHPGIFRSCTLLFLYVGQLGKSVAVLDIYTLSAFTTRSIPVSQVTHFPTSHYATDWLLGGRTNWAIVQLLIPFYLGCTMLKKN